MNKEDKKLLLQDLCARLPYGVKCEVKYYDNAWELLAIYTNATTYAVRDIGYPIETYFEDCKPYLFPLSSMTEEQIKEFWKIEFKDNGGYENDWDFPLYPPKVGNHFIIEALDWLNRNHFDYRGLIEKGLAIDATGKNIY